MLGAAIEGDRVLDLGYARLPNPSLHARDVVGYDLQRPAESPSNYTELRVGDVMQLSDACTDRFDTIICGELIEHVERPYDLLRQIHEVLVPGGLLLLTTPNPVAWPPLPAEWTMSRRRLYTEGHVYYFAPRWVVRMLERTAFAVERIRGVGLWLPFGVIPWCPAGFSYQVLFAARATGPAR